MTHLFLSPHYDDAVFSCGAAIHQLTRRGEAVVIVTVMGGEPPHPLPDSPFVRELHTRWKAGQNPVIIRRREDERAAQALGAHVSHMSYPDVIYRTVGGQPLALRRDDLFGELTPGDPALRLLETLPDHLEGVQTIYVPMGAGRHIDHQIVRDWGLRLARALPALRFCFYEEYPYIRDQAAVGQALEILSAQIDLRPQVIACDAAAVAAKIEAIACYTSQFSSFWPDRAALDREIRQIMKATGGGSYAERLYDVERPSA